MVKWLTKKSTGDWINFLIGVCLMVILNQYAGIYFGRFDLTEEKRFSIKPATKNVLKELDDRVFIDVYLEGELNAPFQRFQKSIKEVLQEFSIYSDDKIVYRFIDPSTAVSQQARNEFMADLASRGIQPTNIVDTRDGNRVEKLIFPGALVNYKGIEKGVMLLQGRQGEQQLNGSIENLEYNLISAIYQLTSLGRKKVGFIQGHGESDSLEIISLQNTLFKFYDIKEIDLPHEANLTGIDIAIISKPTLQWTEQDKYKLDQYIMNGGKALFMIDRTDADMNKANEEDNLSFPVETNLEDLLFKYGIRVNADLIQDNNAAVYPIVVGNYGQDQANIVPIPWPYYPVLNHYGDHIISRNMDAVLTRFSGTLDTVKADGIKKTPLIMTSQYSRAINTPAHVSIADLRKNLNPESLNQSFLPVSYLLEGSFTSLYKNRFTPKGIQGAIKETGEPTKIIVISDGDFGTNELNSETGEPLPVGQYNFQPNLTYSNVDFILNAVSYLVEEDGIITARSRQIQIRPLDKVKLADEKQYWQALNLLLPLGLLLLMGVILRLIRINKFSKF